MHLRTDPNALAVFASRRSTIQEATGPLVKDRCEFFSKCVKGREVLDVGCVNHSAETSTHEDWLHRHLARNARFCLGVDILERDVEELAAAGYSVRVWDVTDSPLHQTFDVIVCGELIEHLGNPGGLFANCRVMLKPGGRLYVSTPNPWFVNYLLKAALSRAPIIENADHVAWFEPCVLTELAGRNGFRLVRYYGIQVTHTNTWKAKMFFKLMPFAIALGFRKELFAKSIIYEFAADDEGGADQSAHPVVEDLAVTGSR
jgi:2-polyprenyl-3-methyl-5-hydroxy-6-metoxy-1,4-benzoquinol methylase